MQATIRLVHRISPKDTDVLGPYPCDPDYDFKDWPSTKRWLARNGEALHIRKQEFRVEPEKNQVVIFPTHKSSVNHSYIISWQSPKTLKAHEDGCPKCTWDPDPNAPQSLATEPHPCPYKVELEDDHTLCQCCYDCKHECAQDV